MTRSAIRLLLPAGGAGLIVFLVMQVGPGTFWSQLHSLRVSLPLLIIIGLIRLGLQTWNWSMALSADGIFIKPLPLVRARLASNSLSYLTSMGPLVAEPAKLALLRDRVAAIKSAPATLAETALYWFTSVLLGLAGILAGAFYLGRGSRTASALWTCGAVFLAAVPLLWARTSLLTLAGRLLARFGAALPSWLRKGAEIENGVRSFRIRNPRAALKIVALDVVSQALMVMEVLVVFGSLFIPTSFLAVLAVEAVTRASKIASAWIPARLGVDEGGAVAACVMFGIGPAAGLTLSLARRARDLLWCVAGLICLGLFQVRDGRWTRPIRRHLSPMKEDVVCER